MDSLTQVALGAAVGEAVLGRKVGRKAALWGAVCGTLPDLDVLVRFSSDVANFTYHRSFSHSLLVLALLTPLMVWLIRKVHPTTAEHTRGWAVLVYLSFATHVLLDSFTIYGTQIFWPVVSTPMTWGSLFIIDPVFTLPLIVGVIAVAVTRDNPGLGYRVNGVCLALSTVYLTFSFGAKLYVNSLAKESLAQQGFVNDRVLTVAAPFNTILWRVVSMDGNGYHEGWYSLLDSDRDIEFQYYSSRPELLTGIDDHWPVARLQWFTKGFFAVGLEDDDVVITDLRMGAAAVGYVFRFKVADYGNPHTAPVPDRMLPSQVSFDRLPWVWERLKGR